MAATTDPRLDAPAEAPEPGADDIEPVLHETRDRIITGTVTVVPFLLLGVVAWQLWNNLLHWHDLVVFAIFYAFSGLGVTVGFHRLFTHRSFKTSPFMRGLFAVAGSMAIEGPVISWVADHRKHHAFSDRPAIRTARTSTTAPAGAARCAVSRTRTSGGCSSTRSAARRRYARTCSRTRWSRFVDRTFVGWALAGFIAPFLLGWRSAAASRAP